MLKSYIFEPVLDTASYTEHYEIQFEHLGQCYGPGVPKLEQHHHYHELVLGELQYTMVTYGTASAYGGQLHHGPLALEDTLDQRPLEEHGYNYCR